ncbi:DUF4136 domain-containing protein [Sphingomonas sp. RB56-2]|uniref:DUF4136 domain-containing protein n=1 Tax=Sphingomonas brevis TaxID=2908206 RepID=A0ABT0S6K2_9SPHN|nr:DUF4136 domain-containing protein [Sphingomonas brevis]MCL6739997.1 DUF4136 domain-containing protein [Sphingomonas brevis]
MMRIKKLAAAILLGSSALGLSACATGLQTQVSRFQAMPAPQGQSFWLMPADPANEGGLEFSGYAEQVAQHLQALGYTRAPSLGQATMVALVGYGVSDPQTEITSYPSFYGPGYGWGSPFYYGRHSYYWGWNDPYWWGPSSYNDVRTYTYYITEMNLNIRRKVDNISLFEGKAMARSRNSTFSKTVPSLVEAMFTGFPGNSGETIKITIPPEGKQSATSSY